MESTDAAFMTHDGVPLVPFVGECARQRPDRTHARAKNIESLTAKGLIVRARAS